MNVISEVKTVELMRRREDGSVSGEEVGIYGLEFNI